MSYKYSKGATVQGDIKAADDSNRDTQIDFGEDSIKLDTAGATRFKISGAAGAITFNEEYTFPTSDGTADQYLKTDGNGSLSFSTVAGGGGISNLVEDTTPQLGGDLDLNGNKITSTSNGNITIEPHGNGKILFPSLSDFTGFPVLLFTGSSGEVTSSNALKFNPSTTGIGVGLSTGGSNTSVEYVSGQSTPQFKIHAIGDIDDGADFCTETYANAVGGSRFRFVKARGTPSSPLAIEASDEIGRIEWYAYTGSVNGMQAKRTGYIIMSSELDGDGKMEIGATYNGVESAALEIYDNKLTAYKQLFSHGGLYPYVNKGASLGGTSYQWSQVNAATIRAFEDLYIGATNQIFDQAGLGIGINDDYEPHGNESDMEGLILNSKYSVTPNLVFALVKTGSHTVGLGTCGTGGVDEKLVLFGENSTTSFEFRNNVGTSPLGLQTSGSVLMYLSGDGDLGIGTNAPIAKLDVSGKIAITNESATPNQPLDGQGLLYSKNDGRLYWRSYDVAETDLTSGGGGDNRCVYMGYVSLQTTARVVSYDLGQNLGATANNNFKGMIIVPFDGTLDTVILSPKGQDVTDGNFGNIVTTVYKNQSDFGSGTSVTVTGDNYQRKTPEGSNNPKIYSGIYDFSLSVAAGDLIQIKANRSNAGTTDTLVTVVFTES
jgi:hypothetical protein